MSNKKRITVSIDVAQYDFHGLGARNASEYINQLLIDKTRIDNYDRLYQRIRGQLYNDPEFIQPLKSTMMGVQMGNDFEEPETYA